MIGFYRPAWRTIAPTAAAAVSFARPSVWQLHRGAFKDGLLRRCAASVTAPVQDFSAVSDPPPVESFPRDRVSWHFLPSLAYLLGNPYHDERGDFEAVVPFAVQETARLLLVDMGFLTALTNGVIPSLPPLSSAPTIVQGAYVPPPPTGLEMGGDALERQSDAPKNSSFIDLGEVAGDLHQLLCPRLLALPADPALPYRRVHTFDFSGMPPSRHRACAVQWFSFAIAVVVILWVVNRKRRPRKSDPRSDSEGQLGLMKEAQVPSLRKSRLFLMLIVLVLVAPMLVAGLLTLYGWQPSAKANGEPVSPQRKLVEEMLPVRLSEGQLWARRDSERRMTLIGLAGPDCARHCLAVLIKMAAARITPNTHMTRARLLNLGTLPPIDVKDDMTHHGAIGQDVDHKLERFRPSSSASVAALLVESNGTALTSCPAGFDPTGLRKDLQKVIH